MPVADDGQMLVRVRRADLNLLLAVAALYVQALGDDTDMNSTEKADLRRIEDVLERGGR